jgi:hypothetical protein
LKYFSLLDLKYLYFAWKLGSSQPSHVTGTVKDRLQEVPKGDNWPRRHFSFLGDLRDIALRQHKKGL